MKKSTIFKPIKRISLRQELIENILAKIFSGELSGGERLVERDLSEQLGVSRTPIREALLELVSIGMAEMKPNGGVVVCPFTAVQLKNIYQVRQILETQATKMACESLDKELLKDFRREIASLDSSNKQSPDWSNKFLLIDQRFHEMISENCGNERLAQEISRYRNLIQAIRQTTSSKRSTQSRAISYHLKIIDELLAGNAEKAASFMHQHIQEAADIALKNLFTT